MPSATTIALEHSSKLAVSIRKKGKETFEEDEKVSIIDPWQRSIAWKDTECASYGGHHPHVDRKKQILKRYPIIRELYGPDEWTKWIILGCVGVMYLLCWHLGRSEASIPVIVLAAYVFGATIMGILDVCIHECCHGLVAKSTKMNRIFNIIINLAIPIPVAMSFARYHPLHHVYQGDDLKDTDLPLKWEIHLVRGNTFKKMLFVCILPLMYLLRATARYRLLIGQWDVAGIIAVILNDVLIYQVCGWRAIAFLLISFFLGHSYHPVAAHFIQEHYTWTDGQETYNYYGWANSYCLNIGFHVEHHDFPLIAGRKLPLLTLIAHEFYHNQYAYRSWRRVLWDFLTDRSMGPVSRVIREDSTNQ